MVRASGSSIRLLWRVGGSAFLLAWLVHSLSWSYLLGVLVRSNWLLVGVAFGLAPVAVVFRAYRWYLLFPPSERSVAAWSHVHALTYVGSALNLVMPANSGDLARGLVGALHFGSAETYIGSAVLDKWLGLWSLCLIGAVAASAAQVWVAAMVLSVAVLAGWLLLFGLRWLPWQLAASLCGWATKQPISSEELRERLTLPRGGRMWLFVVALLVWSVSFVQFGLLVHALGLDRGQPIPWVLFPLMLVARLFPFAFNGLGSQEWAAVWLSRPLGLDPTASASLSLLVTVSLTAVPALIGVWCLWRGNGKPMKLPDEYRYRVGSDEYMKRWAPEERRFLLFKNGRRLTVAQWNEEANYIFPMVHKAQHPNPLVRWLDSQRVRITDRLVRREAATRVLDIGCESGYVTTEVFSSRRLVVMADLDPAMLQRARASAAPALCFLAADVTRLPFQKGSLDLVVCTEVLEHLEDPASAVQELARVLSPGGRLVMSVPNERVILRLKQWVRRLGFSRMLLGPLSPTLAMGHIQLFTKSELRSMLGCHLHVQRLFFSWPFRLNLFAVAVKSDPLHCRGNGVQRRSWARRGDAKRAVS